MPETICISFTPSHDYREHIYRRVMNERSFGATPGDSFWLGYGDYDEIDPFAKYREEEPLKPITVPAWRARIEKAKQDIEKHKSEQRVQLLAESISGDQILTEIEVIRRWANSLKQTQSQTGLHASTKAGMS